MLEKFREYCQFEYNSLKNVKDRNYDWFVLDINKDNTIQRMMGAGQFRYLLGSKVDAKEVETIYYEYVEKVRAL